MTKPKNQRPFKKVLYFILFLILFSIFIGNYASKTPKIYHNAEILVEIDCSSSWNLTEFSHTASEIFAEFGVNASFVFHNDLPVSSLSFSYSNVSEFAYYSNSTKNFSNSIHILVLDNFSANGVSAYIGYAPKSSLWFDSFSNLNALNPSYTSCIVAAQSIIDQTGRFDMILKVILHELGHYLGCVHDSNGIMRQGIIDDFYYSQTSIGQMCFDEIWSRDIGFGYYS